jgi:osmotically-inducible protein OsmY
METAGLGRARRVALGVALALMAGCAAEHLTPEQTKANIAVEDQVYAALAADPNYFFRHVRVHARDGAVDLSGFVWTNDAIVRARQITQNVPGVTRVTTTRLELQRNPLRSGGGLR